ncbi:MAG: ABC transporter permease [Porphyromonas sp.]|nr:ABC transporter permease [Porphyromonas sp.]
MRRLFGKEQWDELWYTLRSNKKRSLVTSLGVFAGMFFFTVLMGLGIGLSNSAMSVLDGVSHEAVVYTPGRTTMPYQGYKAKRTIMPNYRDYHSLLYNAKTIKDLAAVVNYNEAEAFGDTQVRIGNKSKDVQVFGLSYSFSTSIITVIVLHGRYMKEEEIENGVPVCVIGVDVAEVFYPDDPTQVIGKYADIGGVAYRVVGVVSRYSDAVKMGFDINESIQIPLKNAVKNNYDKFVMLMANPKPGVTKDEMVDEIFSHLSRQHHIHPEDTDSIIPLETGTSIEMLNMIRRGIFILIWIAGLGTIISGVIGVSNILLVTVRERQREIGVRRALGAKPRDITLQFMAESVAIILMAGIAGTLLGIILTLAIGQVAEMTPIGDYLSRPYPTPAVLVFSVMLMIFCGVLAGLLPVRQALKIKAIDAIRDE